MFGLYSRAQIMEYEKGLLYEDGRYVSTLGPGRYRLWKIFRTQTMVKVDARLMSVAIPAQEILTQDKLPLRLTLIAQFRVADPAKAIHSVQNYLAVLYEELQLAMRSMVGQKTMDDLFAEKEPIGKTLTEQVRPRAAEFGVELVSCGLKDIVLPGEIKSLLTKVAEAERAAQAALVTAREELAATRCQVNTAKLINENPAILRLKELQALTEIAKKPGNHTIVFGQPFLGKPA